MSRIKYDVRYWNDLKELLLSQPELAEEINQRTLWFSKNSNDTRLGNHDLHKKMLGQWSFWITDDVRIVYKWLGKNEVRFLAIGGHSKVYK